MAELLVIAVSIVIALAGIAFVRRLAGWYAAHKSRQARRLLELRTGETFTFVYAFGRTAIGFNKDNRIWQVEAGEITELPPKTIAHWYLGPVFSPSAISGARTPSPLYLILIGANEETLMKLGLADDSAETGLRPFLMAALPGKERNYT